MKVYTKQSKMWGTLRTDKPPKGIMRACDIVLIVCCVLTAAIYVALDAADFYPEAAFIVIGIMGPFCVISRISVKNEWKRFCKQMEAEHANDEPDEYEMEELPVWTAEESFYNKCLENQISTLDAAGIARLKLLAKQLKMEEDEEKLIQKFKKGQAGAENRKQVIERNQNRLKLKTLLEQEALQEQISKKYINSVGSDKRVSECAEEIMRCKSRIQELKKEAEDYTKKMSNISTAYTQKETDWAVHGGIASGIAGVGAGVAVASDIQRKNKEIRAANEQLHETVANAAGSYLVQNRKLVHKLEEQAEYWKAEEERAKLKLVAEYPQEKLLDMLAPVLCEAKRTETGAMKLTVSTEAASMTIYETAKATVDGVFAVRIMDGETMAGIAYFTLPFKGSENSANLSSICTNLPKEQKEYTFQFTPHNLFAIEL